MSVRRFRHVCNGTSSDGNSSDEVFFCFHNGFLHHVTWSHVSGFFPPGEHMKHLVYETVVETEEDLVARITVAAGTIADMPGNFERTQQSMVRRCTACIQANGRAIRAVPVNATAVISMLNYLLCKSSIASEIAVRDHMYHYEIYICLDVLYLLYWFERIVSEYPV